MHELAGSMGDFGTLLPLAIGYVASCGLDPAGFLVMMGLANIAAGMAYGLPMPIEPMKALAVVAIAQHWTPSMVYASGFGMGLVWLFLASTNLISWVAKLTPRAVVMGIQATLGLMLASEALRLGSDSWILALIGVGIVLLLRKNRYAPAAVVLVLLGLSIMFLNGDFAGLAGPRLSLPPIAHFTAAEVWAALLIVGFAQVPLTATNAVIATSSVIKGYWPNQDVGPRKLSFSHSIMNLLAPWFGGMPMCHGSGGLVGQYFYGARTAGANYIEGTIEVVLGLFFSGSIATLFLAFPKAIIGAMMFLVGLELMKFARHLRRTPDLLVLATTVTVGLAFNMAWGFLAGVTVHWLIERMVNRHRPRQETAESTK